MAPMMPPLTREMDMVEAPPVKVAEEEEEVVEPAPAPLVPLTPEPEDPDPDPEEVPLLDTPVAVAEAPVYADEA
jgi:hypothetical protein